MSDLFLETMEADAFGILANTPGLVLPKILRTDEGLTEADVQQKLVTLTGADKIGLGIVVLQAEVVSAEKNLPGPVMRSSLAIQVIEQVLLNRGANGTGIRASTAALRVAGALHMQRLGGTMLYLDKNPLEPLPGKKGYVSYLVTLYSDQNGVGAPARVSQLWFALDEAGDIVITSETEGAEIYYTVDGGFPGPSNDAAMLYDGPVEAADGLTIRACAFLPPLNPSDLSEVTVIIAGDAVTLNGEEMTMGGAAILL